MGVYTMCAYLHTHTYSKGPHTYKALQDVSSVSRIHLKATTNYTLIALVKIWENLKSFYLFFNLSTQTQHEKCFIKVQNTLNLFQYLTYEFINCPSPPKKNQSLQITHLYYKITESWTEKKWNKHSISKMCMV